MIFKTFFLHAKDIFASMTPSLRGVKLEVRGGFSYDRRDREQVLCLGPHCQCAGKAEVARSREAWVVKMVRWKKGHKKKVRVPCYAISEAASKMKASGQCTKAWSLIGLSFAGVDRCLRTSPAQGGVPLVARTFFVGGYYQVLHALSHVLGSKGWKRQSQ